MSHEGTGRRPSIINREDGLILVVRVFVLVIVGMVGHEVNARFRDPFLEYRMDFLVRRDGAGSVAVEGYEAGGDDHPYKQDDSSQQSSQKDSFYHKDTPFCYRFK